MLASSYGHLEVVRPLLQGEADVNAKNKVRNKMMMMMMMMMIVMMIITVLTIIIMMNGINYENKDDCR